MDYLPRDDDDELILPPSGEEPPPPDQPPARAFNATPYELAPESPPPVSPARHPLPPPDPGGFTYGLRPQGPPPLPTQVAQCPMCRVIMPPSAVLCVACGYHRGLKRHIQADTAASGAATVGCSAPVSTPSSVHRHAAPPPLTVVGGALETVRWCATCGGDIPPGVAHCPRCNLTVNQKLGDREPSVAAGYVAELAIPVAAVLAVLALTPAAVAWAAGLGGPLLAMVVLVILVNASLGAGVVRLACWVSGEDVPEWPRAAALCFLAGVVNGGCNLALRYLPIHGFGGVLGALILTFAAPGMVFFLLLEVTFWKGVFIYAIYYLILLTFLLLLGAMLGVVVMMW